MEGTLITQESRIPSGCLVPDLWSSAAGDEFPVAKQQHAFDLVFDLYKDDASAPVSGTWTIMRPPKAGVITNVQAWEAGVGTNANNNTVDVHKNGSTVLTTPITFNNGDTANLMKSGTLTSSPLAFAADDRIAAVIVKHASNDGVGLKVRIRGYYIGF
ncbi:MAG: hypothetical protein AB7G28_22815 [Pirellulales bacterium]